MKDTLYRLYLLLTKPFIPILARLTTLISVNDRAFPYFKKYKYVYLKEDYNLPIPVGDEVQFSINAPRSKLVGLNLETKESLNILDTVYPRYKSEFLIWLEEAESNGLFNIYNSSYMSVDSEIYYSIIREYKPKRIIEIGSGKSTIVAAAAIAANFKTSQVESRLVSIEPYPNEIVKSGIANIHGLSSLIPEMVQRVDLKIFTELRENDILFIDSTHALKQGGDVHYIYNEILPRLHKGVVVHVHDVSLPDPYPPVYLEHNLYWNEQYVLQALLTHNSHYTVLWPGTYMALTRKEKLLRDFPTLPGMYKRFPHSNPSSFWFRIVS